MTLVKVGDADALRLRVMLSIDGAWHAVADVDASAAPTGSVTIAADGGFSLTGAVVSARTGVDSDVAHVRIVGGAGGLASEVSAAFRSARLRDALNAIASATGETLDSSIDSDLLDLDLRFLTLGKYGAGRALGELASIASAATGDDVRWRITSGGKLWMGAEAWTAATLPAGADITERHPGEGRYVIGCTTPALLPGVDLEDVGQVVAVEHVVEPGSVRTIAWTSTAPAERMRRASREAIGLDGGSHLPAIDRLALYRAEIKACASDGSTVDLQPENPSIPAMQKVPVKPCAAGDVAVMAAGTVCRIGWEEGNPTKPFAVPAYDMGATPTKRIINGSTVFLGAESGAQFVALANLVNARIDAIQQKFDAHIHTTTATIGPSAVAGVISVPTSLLGSQASVAASQVKAK